MRRLHLNNSRDSIQVRVDREREREEMAESGKAPILRTHISNDYTSQNKHKKGERREEKGGKKRRFVYVLSFNN
jgi:hypothetical protein